MMGMAAGQAMPGQVAGGGLGQQNKELDCFYSKFIQIFKATDHSGRRFSLEMQLQQGGDNRNLTEYDLQMRSILDEFEKTPNLSAIFSHVVTFMLQQNVKMKSLC